MASIRKRTWTTQSGKSQFAYECSYQDNLGFRRRKQFKKKKQAEIFLIKVQNEVLKGIHTPETNSLTLNEVSKLWIKKKESELLEKSTLLQYETFIRKYLTPYLGSLKLSKLNTPLIQNYINNIIDKTSIYRAKVCRNHLSAIISYAQKLGLTSINPVLPIKLRISKRLKKRVEIPSKKELRMMLEKCPEKFNAFLTTAIFTGMRSSELLGLSWDQIDFDKQELEVTQRLDRITGKLGAPKSRAGYRKIPLSQSTIDKLLVLKSAEKDFSSNLVFINTQGRPYRHTNLMKQFWIPLQKKCGLTNIQGKHRYKFHSLRHAAASLFIENGFNLKQLQTIIGHENISLTIGTYGHLMEESKPDFNLMKKVEDSLFG
jgi:integrase